MFKPLTLSAHVSYVHSGDPAVDWAALVAQELDLDPELRDNAGIEAQAKENVAVKRFMQKYVPAVFKDPSQSLHLLKFKTGETPTKYTIGVIPPDDMNRISDECKADTKDVLSDQLRWRAFMSCLRGVENFGSEKIPTIDKGGVSYVDPTWIKQNFVRGLRAAALSVGHVAWQWNQISDVEIKN